MGELLLIGGLLTAAALASSLLAGRLRVPALLMFLFLGMAVGTDGLGWLHLDDYEVARDIGVVALAVILYEGGLTTRIEQLRPVVGTAASLAILGTILTGAITGLAATWLFDLSLLEGLLLGSIVASTDVAAIFALLRGSGLQPRMARLLEGEAASNDPVAILLVIGFIEWIQQPGYGIADMALLFVEQFAIGAAAGLAIGWLMARLMRRAELPTVGLYPVASLTAGALSFGLAEVLGGSGFLAIYLTGLTLSASSIPARRTIVAFHDGLAWVGQLTLFLTLGLLVFPSQLGSIALEGTALALILVFVSRPLASLAATAFASLSAGERIVLAWAGLRGAVPVVLATFPVIAGIENSLEFFNIVFFAVVVSLLIHGPTFEAVAARFGLTSVEPTLPEPLTEIGTIRGLGGEVVEYVVGGEDAVVGARVRELGLPREAVVNLIVRGEEAIPPRGSTRIESGDALHMLVRREVSDEVVELTKRWRRGPLETQGHRRSGFQSAAPVFTTGPGDAIGLEGEIGSPSAVMGQEVVARLRVRRDRPGALVALGDGRYAITGEVSAVGSRQDLSEWAMRRMRRLDEEDGAWLQTVIGALAIDAFR